MTSDYSHLLIKDFTYWTLNIHENQGYLGRCVLLCKRADALDLAEATPEEQKELFELLPKIKKALYDAFQPDWYNYSFLGNGFKHLHGHIIPRYASPRIFEGVTFEDKRWGHNWRTDHEFTTTAVLLSKVQDKIKSNLF